MQITTDAQREAALNRAQELMGALEDTPEEYELEELSDAVDEWDHRASMRRAYRPQTKKAPAGRSQTEPKVRNKTSIA